MECLNFTSIKGHCNDRVLIIHCAVFYVSGTELHLGTLDFCLVQNKRKIDSAVKLNNTVLDLSTIVVKGEQMLYLLPALHNGTPFSKLSKPEISNMHFYKGLLYGHLMREYTFLKSVMLK